MDAVDWVRWSYGSRPSSVINEVQLGVVCSYGRLLAITALVKRKRGSSNYSRPHVDPEVSSGGARLRLMSLGLGFQASSDFTWPSLLGEEV